MKVIFRVVEVKSGKLFYLFESVINGVSVYEEDLASLLYTSVAVKIFFQRDEKLRAAADIVLMKSDGGMVAKSVERERRTDFTDDVLSHNVAIHGNAFPLLTHAEKRGLHEVKMSLQFHEIVERQANTAFHLIFGHQLS